MTVIIAAIRKPARYAMPYSTASYARATYLRAGKRPLIRGEELYHPVVVLRPAGLLHPLLHTLQARGAPAGDELLRRFSGLRHGLDAALLQLGLLLLPQRLQVALARGLLLERDALPELAPLMRERL